MSDFIFIEKSFDIAIQPYFSKKKSVLANLAGYLTVDIEKKIAIYHDLS